MTIHHIDGLVQGRRNSSALVKELQFSCTKPSICMFKTDISGVNALFYFFFQPKSHVFKSQLQFLSDFGRCVMDTKDGTKSRFGGSFLCSLMV